MSSFQELLGVTKVGDNYESNHALTKPHPKSRGVFGGNLAGQALLVAIRSAPEGFAPHSLHSYFVKNVSDHKKVLWEVEEISNGKTFCNRSVTALQNGETKYIASISLTKKNSLKKAESEHKEYLERRIEKPDDDDDRGQQKPFSFQTPFPTWLAVGDIDKMDLDTRGQQRQIFHKMPHQLALAETKYEDAIPVTERGVSFYVQLGMDNIKITDPAFQYVGLGILSDSLFLTKLARLLRISTANLDKKDNYFSVSLDHVMYFHDTDFDCTKWMGFGFRAVRLVNNRVLLEGEMFNDAGQHVATIIQEGLVHFNGLEKGAKL